MERERSHVDESVRAEFAAADGRLIFRGNIDDKVTVFSIFDLRRERVVSEFWTLNGSVSPKRDAIVFTAFTALHFLQSAYTDTMVYVFDVGTSSFDSPGTQNVPSGAIAVYPPALIGSLEHVVSSIRWESSKTAFLIVGPDYAASPRVVRDLRVSLGHDKARRSTASARLGAPVLCRRPDFGDQGIDAVRAACPGV